MRKTALLIAITALCMAHAQLASARPMEGFYASIHGGVNFLEDSNLEISIHGGVNFLEDSNLEISIPNNPPLEGGLVFDTGWAAGVAFGYQWQNGFALEGETTYRENGLKRQEMMGMTGDISGDINSFTAMLNAKYELDTDGPFSPFIGVGIGSALITVDANPNTPDAFKQSDAEHAAEMLDGFPSPEPGE